VDNFSSHRLPVSEGFGYLDMLERHNAEVIGWVSWSVAMQERVHREMCWWRGERERKTTAWCPLAEWNVAHTGWCSVLQNPQIKMKQADSDGGRHTFV